MPAHNLAMKENSTRLDRVGQTVSLYVRESSFLDHRVDSSPINTLWLTGQTHKLSYLVKLPVRGRSVTRDVIHEIQVIAVPITVPPALGEGRQGDAVVEASSFQDRNVEASTIPCDEPDVIVLDELGEVLRDLALGLAVDYSHALERAVLGEAGARRAHDLVASGRRKVGFPYRTIGSLKNLHQVIGVKDSLGRYGIICFEIEPMQVVNRSLE
jgi:hypothetical protein